MQQASVSQRETELTMTRVKSLKTGGEFCEETNMMLNSGQTQNQKATVYKYLKGIKTQKL